MPSPQDAQTITVWTHEGVRVVEASQAVLHLGEALDDERLPAEVGSLSGRTIDLIPYEQSASVEVYADVRLHGEERQVRCRVLRPSVAHIREQFFAEYAGFHGVLPADGLVEIVTLHVRRFGKCG
jgi:hypothetical protein